jgi:Zn-dependent protease
MSWFLILPGALLAPILHEWVKARVSHALGDRTPMKNGYLSGRPWRFVEPVGFIFMLAFGVGWGRPVPTNALHYRDRRMGVVLTYSLPIVANLLAGLGTMALWSVLTEPVLNAFVNTFGLMEGISWFGHLGHGVHLFAQMNLNLAIFSLLPIAPMAGSKILPLFVNPHTAFTLTRYEKQAQMIMMLLLIFGIIQGLVMPISTALMRIWM